MTATLDSILADIRHCKVCTAYLPHQPRPVVQAATLGRSQWRETAKFAREGSKE
jgi:hypothetical protein